MTINSYRSPSIQDVERETESASRKHYMDSLEAFRDVVIQSCKMTRDATTSTASAVSTTASVPPINSTNGAAEVTTLSAVPGVFFVISNFSRKVLGQTGDGHFSPIGGELLSAYFYISYFVVTTESKLLCSIVSFEAYRYDDFSSHACLSI